MASVAKSFGSYVKDIEIYYQRFNTPIVDRVSTEDRNAAFWLWVCRLKGKNAANSVFAQLDPK